MATLRNAEIKTYQDETTGKWHASVTNSRNGKLVLATDEIYRYVAADKQVGYETEQAAIDALIIAYRRSIGG